MKRRIRGLMVGGFVLVAMVLTTGPAQAGITTIDFEGLGDVTPITSIAVPGNVVTFSIVLPTGAVATAYTAQVGGPVTAFVSNDAPAGMQSGTFLTDEAAGPNLTGEYRMQFANPVSSLSLDLYDYRVDGGPAAGDQAILTVYSDLFTTAIGTTSFTIPASNPIDGNIEHLAIALGSFDIVSAALTFTGADVGTGIDNVSFATVPAPGALILGAIGSGMVGWFRRRKSL
ncbi:MAG: hypothetical protein JSW27_04790 [Phycisphaerales bacterium]|nr:MAG: hypothetical protein JSW27_04790 [Phycisphaerales bacterium]